MYKGLELFNGLPESHMLRGIVGCENQGSGKLRITRPSIPAWITSPYYLFYILDNCAGSGVMARLI